MIAALIVFGAAHQPVQQLSRKVCKFEQSWLAYIFDHRGVGKSYKYVQLPRTQNDSVHRR
jgi:hypothetical protein